MKILVIYSNHHTHNFNFRLLERLKKKALQTGDEMVVRDLYQMNFDPVLRTRDFEMISSGNTPEDIQKEQDFIKWADVLLFIYPVWWGGMPAILKGYIDKVFSWGFAYGSNGKGPYPLLNDKKAVMMNSLGQSKSDYENGMFQSMDIINTQGIFGFCGIEIISQLYFTSIHGVTEAEIEKYFEEAEAIFEKLPVSS